MARELADLTKTSGGGCIGSEICFPSELSTSAGRSGRLNCVKGLLWACQPVVYFELMPELYTTVQFRLWWCHNIGCNCSPAIAASLLRQVDIAAPLYPWNMPPDYGNRILPSKLPGCIQSNPRQRHRRHGLLRYREGYGAHFSSHRSGEFHSLIPKNQKRDLCALYECREEVRTQLAMAV